MLGRQVQQIFFGVVSQNRRQRRVDLEQLALGIADVHAFLQRFEQLGEALLLFSMPGDVARQHAGAGHFVTLDDSVDHAVVIKAPGIVLQVDFDHS